MPRVCDGCCGMCRPRWLRLVDNIYPRNYTDRQANAPKLNSLTHYSCRNPEKLTRIAEYLEKRMQRELYRKRTGYVSVTMDIIDNLIKSCQRLDNFISIYLGMVNCLLESKEPELQIMGTQSFEKYSQIDKETPNYLTEYGTLLDRFVRMCHESSSDKSVVSAVRCAGLQGVMSIVRKIASDDLQINIWEQHFMNQIVSAIMFNLESDLQLHAAPQPEQQQQLQENGEEEEADAKQALAQQQQEPPVGVGDVSLLAADAESQKRQQRACEMAKDALVDLVMRANYSNINCIVEPVLTHLDNNADNLWVPNHFAVFAFRTIISHIPKPNQAYTVVERVIQHLSSPTIKSTTVKKSIVQVVSSIVGYAASDAVGPAVYNVFKELCKQLKHSIHSADEASQVEAQYREEVINTMVRYAEAAPDTQKVEIMKYILSFEAQHARVEASASCEAEEERRRKAMLKSLLRTISLVADNYTTTHIASAFPFDFLPPLLKISVNSDPSIRVIVQNILQFLIDRHGNRSAYQRVNLHQQQPQPLRPEPPKRQDSQFIRSAMGSELLTHLHTQLQEETNRVDNFEKIYTTLCLLAIETAAPDCVVQFYRLGLQTQQFLCSSNCSLKIVHKSAAMAVVAALFSLLCHLLSCQPIADHVAQVVAERQAKAPHFLPKVAFNRANTAKSYSTEAISEELLFSEDIIEAALSEAGLDTSTLRQPYESLMDLRAKLGDDISTRDFRDFMLAVGAKRDRRESAWSLAPTPSEESEPNGSDIRRSCSGSPNEMDVSFGAFRKIMYEPSALRVKRMAEEEREIKELYDTASFGELLERHRQQKATPVNEVVAFLKEADAKQQEPGQVARRQKVATINEIEFPSLFAF